MSDRSNQLLGNYQVARKVGQGSFSDVYLGKHIHLETYAAIKVLRTQLAEDSIKSFRIEARILAGLQHPNIIRVLDLGIDGATPYLVMQYALNGTLRQRHPSGTPVAPNIVVSYVQQLASALQYTHNQKLIHRDIKPENMLVGEQSQILLSDFGIAVMTASARAVGPADASWDSAGTASYMAPEQIQGQTVLASDQYALAIVVYEWLTGMLPFQGSYTEVISQQMAASPPSMRAKTPLITPEIEHVVFTALHKDPQRRFGHIEAFSNALKQAAQGSLVPDIVSQKTPGVSNMEATLIGPFGQTVIGATKVTIGRAPDCTIVLSDMKVSFRHAEVKQQGQQYILTDLGSTRGSSVNTQRIESKIPHVLQPRDSIRLGDTTIIFEMRDGSRVSDGLTMWAEPLMVANNISYGDQAPTYVKSGKPAAPYTPPAYAPPSRAHTPPPHMPPPPSHAPQQPAYTPSEQKRPPLRGILLAVTALLIILSSVGGMVTYHNHAVAQDNINATATAHQQAVARQQATAQQQATATALVTSPYPPFTVPKLNDTLKQNSASQWEDTSYCQFTAAGYQISIAQVGDLQLCLANNTNFSDFAYRVTMTIKQGNCGGLILRAVDGQNFYLVEVCQNGTYNRGFYLKNASTQFYDPYKPSATIRTGLNQPNILDVTMQGNVINLYINNSPNPVDTFTDPNPNSTFSKGQIGVSADPTSSPTVVTYTNALVWTA